MIDSFSKPVCETEAEGPRRSSSSHHPCRAATDECQVYPVSSKPALFSLKPIWSNSLARCTPAEPPTAASLKAIARAAVSAALKASGVPASRLQREPTMK